MYDYIKGNITDINSNYIVIDNNNIGYLIYVSNPYYYKLDNIYKIYTYNLIKEDECLLYGFTTKEERTLFLKLISVKGLGCKMALPILASSTVEEIYDAIENENIIYLKKFPKIGDKIARQIILELKGKLKINNNVLNDNKELISVLSSLGYKNNDIKKIIPNIDSNLDIEIQIKNALKLLLK